MIQQLLLWYYLGEILKNYLTIYAIFLYFIITYDYNRVVSSGLTSAVNNQKTGQRIK